MDFPAPVPPTKATVWPGGDAEIHAGEDGAVGAVAEGDALEDDLAACGAEGLGVRRVLHVVLVVEHLEASLSAGGCAFQRPCDLGERLERLVEHEQVGGDGDERADAECARQHML